MAWTLTIDGDEQAFAAYGIRLDSCQLFRRNGAASVLRLDKPGAMDGELLAEYDSEVVVRKDGVNWFVGYCCPPDRTNDGGASFIGYELRDWWWKAERIIYHQLWHQVTGIGPGGVKTYTDVPVPNVFLGVALDGTYWTNGEQIADALEYLISQGVNIQVGTIDPAVNLFSVEGRSMSCAEVIRAMMAHSPDCQISTDFTTSPPTVHVRRASSLTNVTLTAGTDPIRALRLRPRYDLLVPVVVIHFKTTNVVEGNNYPSWTKQVYPPNPGPMTDAAWETQIGAVITTLELEGSQTSYARGAIMTAAVAAGSATAADRVAWWQQYEKPLASPYIDPASVSITTPSSVKDRDGADVSLSAYPYELLDGSVAPWMNVAVVANVTIKALVSYTLYSVDVVAYQAAHSGALPPDNFIIKKVVNREIHVERTLCNYNTGGEFEDFSIKASFAEGEPEPAGLAQSYYESLNTLRYEGTLTTLHADLPAVDLMSCKLTLAGTALTIANQLVQGTTENLVLGTRSIQIGPPTVLDITSLMDLHRACRYRRVWNNPALRTTGDPGASALAFGRNNSRQDTTSGNGAVDTTAVTASDVTTPANTNVVRHTASHPDHGNLPVLHVQQLDGAGQEVDSVGSILLQLSRAMGEKLKLREAVVCDSTGPIGYCLGIFSELYTEKKFPDELALGEDAP